MKVSILLPLLLILSVTEYSHPSEPGTLIKNIVKSTEGLEPLEWWQNAVVYQVYPRSFQDSDGDGIGDIKGIISRLDYFIDLGVEAVWISPIYESPMKDFGYDVSNFTNIDPIFGTLDDFKELLNAFHENGIRIIMDLVPNHSSDMHPWFEKSVNREGKYADYYVWRDPKGFDEQGIPIPPNNWTSMFSGSMWEWNEKRQQFYLHQFVKGQPDLNYENRHIWNEILAVVKFWLDVGLVDGFRVGATAHLYEDQRFMDEPVNPSRPPNSKSDEYRFYNHIYTKDLPGVLNFLAEIRQILDIYTVSDGKVRFMMIETVVSMERTMEYYGTLKRPIAHFPLNHNLIGVRQHYNAKTVADLVNLWYEYIPEGEWATIMLGNHDYARMSQKFSILGIDAANMINILLPATPITYNGEEIGMEDKWISWEDTVDPGGCNVGPERYEQFSRDPARTPMQWDSSKNAGFSTAERTWLPVHENYVTKNVAAQLSAEESHLKIYKKLIELRKRNVSRYGNYSSFVFNNDTVLGFARTISSSIDNLSFVVLANFSHLKQIVDLTSVSGVPLIATVYIRSVGFENQEILVGSEIPTNAVPLGARNSIVLTFPLPPPENKGEL